MVLDISGSMNALYKSGKVQRLAERILALGTRFDDDGSIDIFLFGTDSHQAGALDIANYQGFVDRLLQRYPLEGGTQYDRAISEVRRFYFGSDAPRTQPLSQPTPVYVMFVTDGATADPESTKRQVIHSSYEPVFWQFMGIGKSSRKPGAKKRGFLSSLLSADFAFLEQLDILPGRFVDNANFFSVE